MESRILFNFSHLNDKQLQAVNVVNGPVLVMAGAGSGKTRALTYRIYNLVKNHNIKPGNILAITFTNKATNEMKERLADVNNGQMQISTFHAFCAKILREFIFKLDGYTKYFTIYNEDERVKLLKKIIADLNYTDSEFVKEVNYHISNAKNNGLTPDEYETEYVYVRDIDKITKVYSLYEQQMTLNNALDFDDLLTKMYQLLTQHTDVLNYLQDRYLYIHVDEFQDTNLIQYKILRLIGLKHKNVFVVGDDDQSIYGWRGANIENTSLFLKDFAPVEIIKLEQNYRSTKHVLEVANKLIVNNTSRMEKVLWTENENGETVHFYKAFSDRDEAEFVVRSVYELINDKGVNPSEIAILFRMGALSRLFEERLLNYNIPYSLYGAFKFFERVEIRNILSYLWLLYNPNDNESFKRIINYPKRGIGKTTIQKLETLSAQTNTSMYNIVLNLTDYDLGRAVVQKLMPLQELLLDIKQNCTQTDKPTKIFDYVLKKSQITEQYNKEIEEDNDRLLNIGQLQNSISTFEYNNAGATLIDFLQSVTLESAQDTTADSSDTIKVSTVHAVKGLEFTAVFIVGAEEGIFPISRASGSDEELNEERRLMYVAVTRSKKYLIISCADSRYLYNSRSNMIPSRFLREMELVKQQPVNSFIYKTGHPNFKNASFSNYNANNNQVNEQINTKMNNNTQTNATQIGSNLKSLMDEKLKKQSQNFTAFTVGTQVLHPKFGVGTIINSNLEQGNNSVDVKFTTFGVKSLNLEFAPLQIIPNKK